MTGFRAGFKHDPGRLFSARIAEMVVPFGRRYLWFEFRVQRGMRSTV